MTEVVQSVVVTDASGNPVTGSAYECKNYMALDFFFIDNLYKIKLIHFLLSLDASGNQITEQLQSVVVTDASGNIVTGM